MRPATDANRRRMLRAASAGACAALGLPARAQTKRPLAFKWANNIPLAHPSTLRLQQAASEIGRASQGEIDIQFFPNSQLGSETDLLSQLRAGAIDFLQISGLTLQTLVPLAGVNGLAFAFDDYPAVWAAMDGDLGALVRAELGRFGLHPFERMLDNGFRHITSGTRPIAGAADLRGFRIRVPPSPLWTSTFSALGAAPTTLNFAELYPALQTRLVDGQENPLLVIDIGHFHEVQKFCSMTRHMWDGHWIVANGRRWAALPADARALIARHVDAATGAQRDDARRLNNGLELRLATKGLVFNRPPSESFRAALHGAGYYREWQGRFGAQASALLARHGAGRR